MTKLKSRGMSRTLTVPHSNHHTVGTASWQNHDSSPPQSVIILHCHVCLCLSNPNISSALWRQCKSKNTAHLQCTRLWISPCCQGAGVKQRLKMTCALYIAYARIQKILPEGVDFCNVFYGRIQIPLYKRTIIGPPVKRHLNGVSLACR